MITRPETETYRPAKSVRSPRMVPGYLADEAATARHFVDGWHKTGDLGFQPADQQRVVLGRADDMLNIGGVKVPPQPIETEIKTIAGITDAVLLSLDNSQGVSALHVVIEAQAPIRTLSSTGRSGR